MSYLFLASLAVIFLVILWLPACSVAFWLRGLRVPRPFSGLWIVWPAQLAIAVGLIFLADLMGLHNPAGYCLAIAVGTSVLGPVPCGGGDVRRSELMRLMRPRSS